jgi:hypothetical protein
MPKNSLIWKVGLFRKISSTKVECLEWKKSIQLGKSSSTTNAVSHLNNAHKNSEYTEKYVELKQKEGDEKGATTTKRSG